MTVLPTLAPMITATDWDRVIVPAVTKPTTSTVVTLDELIQALGELVQAEQEQRQAAGEAQSQCEPVCRRETGCRNQNDDIDAALLHYGSARSTLN